MTRIHPGRHRAETTEPLALFLVGMRIHQPLRIRTWWPAFTAMSRMLRQLQAEPQLGLLAATLSYTPHPLLVQYWRSPEHLRRFAHDPALSHRPAWQAFNELTRHAPEAVGLWHELYVIDPATTRSLYRDMPRIGLGLAARHVPAAGRVPATAPVVPPPPSHAHHYNMAR